MIDKGEGEYSAPVWRWMDRILMIDRWMEMNEWMVVRSMDGFCANLVCQCCRKSWISSFFFSPRRSDQGWTNNCELNMRIGWLIYWKVRTINMIVAHHGREMQLSYINVACVVQWHPSVMLWTKTEGENDNCSEILTLMILVYCLE